jgi:carbamoyltransferase
VIHKDGTGRLQIVRAEVDPFTHAYLKAMGRRTGVEVSVNTSLNVGGPIVQTPLQALAALKKSRGMDAILFIDAAGKAYITWHTAVAPPKDGGWRLNQWMRAWADECGVSLEAL